MSCGVGRYQAVGHQFGTAKCRSATGVRVPARTLAHSAGTSSMVMLTTDLPCGDNHLTLFELGH
jgi:hypothetical protein